MLISWIGLIKYNPKYIKVEIQTNTKTKNSSQWVLTQLNTEGAPGPEIMEKTVIEHVCKCIYMHETVMNKSE